MPCACKKKNPNISTSVYVPSSQLYVQRPVVQTYSRALETDRQTIRNVATAAYEAQESDSVYDFSSTIKPDQVCTNCAMKHIAFACTLAETGSRLDFTVACAQLMLASSHYFTYDASMHMYCRELAYSMMLDIDQPYKWQGHLKELMMYTLQLDKPVKVFWDADCSGNFEAVTVRDNAMLMLLNTAQAFSLMFTEITYQNLNKAYAMGALQAASSTGPVPGLQTMRQQLRKMWKMLQEMQTDSQEYKRLRSLLIDMMKSMLSVYLSLAPQSDSL